MSLDGNLEGDPAAADLAFERMLLAAAGTDAPPSGSTEEAWTRLAGRVATLQVGVQVASNAAGLTGLVGGQGWTWLAAGILVGALGGAALTAAWWGSARASVTSVPRVVIVMVPLDPSPMPSSVQVPAAAPSQVALGPAGSTLPSLRTTQSNNLLRISGQPSRSEPGRVPSDGSTLAAETAALDEVKLAIAAGAYSRALQRVAVYHQDYPTGQLSADAEALAIESLRASGDETASRERATRFLNQYPSDPHSARVRARLARGP